MLLTRPYRHHYKRTLQSLSLSSTSSRTSSTTALPPPQEPPPTTTSSSSPNHATLPEFLSHAHRTSLSPNSPTYIGTLYEYTCLTTLSSLGLTLTRTGGRSDYGIDLLGHWHLPSLPYPLRVIVQCKAHRAKPSPTWVRELEGAFAGAPVGWRGGEAVGVLCARREATRGVREAVRGGGRGVVWVMLEGEEGKNNRKEEGRGKVRQVLWNERCAELGFQGVGVRVLYVPRPEGVEKEVALEWKGDVWKPANVGGLVGAVGNT
ncbi:hypothetical protein MMC14_010637, partial [Varicellaria rhodocarpa]|nr:hypothetical protein [Varicellaria rhodocarpa]